MKAPRPIKDFTLAELHDRVQRAAAYVEHIKRYPHTRSKTQNRRNRQSAEQMLVDRMKELMEKL